MESQTTLSCTCSWHVHTHGYCINVLNDEEKTETIIRMTIRKIKIFNYASAVTGSVQLGWMDHPAGCNVRRTTG